MVRPPGRILGGEIIYHDHTATDVTKLDSDSPEMRAIRWGEISMIFQEPMTSLSPVHTVGNQMTEAIRQHLRMNHHDAIQHSVRLLGRVGLPQPERLLNRYRHELSGGMRQRVMIAMALSCHPKLLIADEPTTALDVTTQAQILDLMSDLQEEFGMAIMFITHDLAVIAEMADDVVVMYLGEAVEAAGIEPIFYNAAHPYTQALLRSIPRRDTKVSRLETIVGNVPDPSNIPKGCSFHPRCRYYVPEKCASPELIQIADQHWVRCARSHEINPQMQHTEHAS
jgi:oligopeptide transport system ATP-binding protein